MMETALCMAIGALVLGFGAIIWLLCRVLRKRERTVVELLNRLPPTTPELAMQLLRTQTAAFQQGFERGSGIGRSEGRLEIADRADRLKFPEPPEVPEPAVPEQAPGEVAVGSNQRY